MKQLSVFLSLVFVTKQILRKLPVLLFILLIPLLQGCQKKALSPEPTVLSSLSSEPPKTRGYNYILPNLATNFIHYYQLGSNGGVYPAFYKSWGCLPACCVMGAHYMNPSGINMIPATYNTFNTYCAGMKTGNNGAYPYQNDGTYITDAYLYLKNNVWASQMQNYGYVADPVPGTNASTPNRNTVISKLKTYLSSNHPATVRIEYNKQSKTPSVVKTPGTTIGHWVVIVGLEETTAGIGTVHYYDPSGTSSKKTCSWATFLDAMKAGSNYNIMRIGYN